MCTWHSDFCQLVTLTEKKNLGRIKDQFDMFAYFQHLTRAVFPEDCMTPLVSYSDTSDILVNHGASQSAGQLSGSHFCFSSLLILLIK